MRINRPSKITSKGQRRFGDEEKLARLSRAGAEGLNDPEAGIKSLQSLKYQINFCDGPFLTLTHNQVNNNFLRVPLRLEITRSGGNGGRMCSQKRLRMSLLRSSVPDPSALTIIYLTVVAVRGGGLIEDRRLLPEYHPRQWVDCSSPSLQDKPNLASRIPPTGVGGLFTLSLHNAVLRDSRVFVFFLPSLPRDAREREHR